MTVSLPQHSKELITRCSICGGSVTVELSKTDEGGMAVHESCYVRRTLSNFRTSIDELPKSWPPIVTIGPERSSEPALSGMPWRIFGLIRL